MRERASPVYLGGSRAQCRILGHYKFFVNTQDTGFASHVLVDGYWEIWLTLFIAGLVRPGWSVIDVGANFGYYTLLLGDRVGESGRVLAFEPNPAVARSLRDSVAVNGFSGRTRVEECALCDVAEGVGHFFLPLNKPLNARIVPPDYAPPEPGEIVPIRLSCLDRYMGEVPRVDFVKIDAEGAEFSILEGMRGLIARDRPRMIIEFNAHRANARESIDLLLRHYPRIRHLDEHGVLRAAPAEVLMSERLGQDWLLYVAPDEPDPPGPPPRLRPHSP